MTVINNTIAMLKTREKQTNKDNKKGKRAVIVETNNKVSDNDFYVRPIKHAKSEQTINVLTDALKSHFLFKEVPNMMKVLDALQPLTATYGDTIIWQETEGDKFFVLESGLTEVTKDGKVLNFQQKAGSAFGELALIHGAPRAATIRALDNCKLWYMEKAVFRATLNEMENGQKATQVAFLKKVKLFQDLNDKVLGNIADALHIKEFKDGDKIIKQDDIGEEFFMINSGDVVVTQKQSNGVVKELVRCSVGDYFGELALMKDEPRKANVIAVGDVECFALDRKSFTEMLGPLQEMLDLHKGIRMLRQVKILSELTDKEVKLIATKLTRKIYTNDDFIIHQGEQGNHFFMIERGTVNISIDQNEVGKLSSTSATPFFGEMAIISDDLRLASVIADGEVECALLDRKDFINLLGPLKDIVKREADKRKEGNLGALGNLTGRIGRALSRGTSSITENMVPYSALAEVKTLGTGTFGVVKLVQDERDGKPYALKCLKKKQIIEMSQEVNIFRERDMMIICKHPLILSLVSCYQSKNSLFMLLELVPGGELWVLLHGDDRLPESKIGGISLDDSKFYAANVLAALTCMKKNDIAYRDLKPENLVIDAEGYLRVIDLGFAKIIEEDEKSNTLCGTPEYLAPELVLAKGHTQAVDIWALGILIFELLTNETPFVHDDQTVMFEMIATSPAKSLKNAMPKSIDKASKKLLTKILEPKVALRAGCKKAGYEEIWGDPWFEGFGQDLVERKGLNAPFIPVLKSALDVVNFEVFDPSEEEPTPKYKGDQSIFEEWGPDIKQKK